MRVDGSLCHVFLHWQVRGRGTQYGHEAISYQAAPAWNELEATQPVPTVLAEICTGEGRRIRYADLNVSDTIIMYPYSDEKTWA